MTKETEYVKNVLTILNRDNKIDLLKKSNLYDREINLLVQRFVHGLSLKECAEQFGIEINTVSKNQLKAVRKLYNYMKYN